MYNIKKAICVSALHDVSLPIRMQHWGGKKNDFYAQNDAQVPVINTRPRRTHTSLPSLLMPTLRHFFRRQYWHWFRWCWSIGQSRFPRHV